ncbi:MAG: trimethylamine methyltransferase family protein [Anaerolineales bacterium]|nr:trimethylamine methyltransferase family protein [Anaerolineales bacterium]
MTRSRHRTPTQSPPSKKPFRVLRNPFPPTEVLTPDDVNAIHRTSLRVLEETGLDFWDAETLALLKTAGVKVDEKGRHAWLDRDWVMEMMGKAPAQFTMHSWNPAKNVPVGGNHLLYAPVGGPPFVSDLDRGRRDGNMADVQTLNKLVQMADAMVIGGGHLIEPLDVPVPVRHLETMFYDLTLIDKVPQSTVLGQVAAEDSITMVALAHAGGAGTVADALAGIQHKPAMLGVVNVNSPLRYDGPMLEGLLALARHGQVPVLTPFIIVGANSPITLPAAIMQQNAEVLAGAALVQFVNPGCPVVYGHFITPMDLRSGAVPFGTPEEVWAVFAAAQMARFYHLPFRGGGGLTTSQIPDAQAAYESTFGLWAATMAHANMILQGAGWLDGGLVASFEKFVLDVEIIERFYAFLEEKPINEDSLAVEFIHQIGPGGHHLDTAHTMVRYRTAFHHSELSSRLAHGAWVEQGEQDTAQRANRKWKEMLARYEPPPMDQAVMEALLDYKARRKEVLLR